MGFESSWTAIVLPRSHWPVYNLNQTAISAKQSCFAGTTGSQLFRISLMTEETDISQSGSPDAWLDPVSGVRIDVLAWEPLCRIDDQYMERPRSLRMLWYYLLHVGVVAVARKVSSRRAERRRNRKIVALGAGVVLQAGSSSGLGEGDKIVFLAPNHPSLPKRNMISNDYRFVRSLAWLRQVNSESPASSCREGLAEVVGRWKAWSPFSGMEPDEARLEAALRSVAGRFTDLAQRARLTDASAEGRVQAVERIEAKGPSKFGKSAVVFGLGNYAKTQILPVVKKELDLVCVHEIDPDQFATVEGGRLSLDSSPCPRGGESYDAWFMAGYHHTHAPLAIAALKQSAYAVVEKPIATTKEQFRELLELVESSQTSRLFACFQKRYSKMHEWACKDLHCKIGKPVHMYASVFEIPLPSAHWYNWPASGSRLISNGCHWLDYFMYINGYVEVADAQVVTAPGGDLLATVCLQNEARLVLSLTDRGSARLGVREFVEFRCEDATVQVVDARRYTAENTSRKIRSRIVNPVRAYHRMYTTICRRIRAAEPGDPAVSLRSTELMLRLEQQLRDDLAKGRGCAL